MTEPLDPMLKIWAEVINEVTRRPNPKVQDQTPEVIHYFKSLQHLAQDLRDHANKHAFNDGQLCADLKAAANYLEAMAND
jgi:hypothetical protein